MWRQPPTKHMETNVNWQIWFADAGPASVYVLCLEMWNHKPFRASSSLEEVLHACFPGYPMSKERRLIDSVDLHRPSSMERCFFHKSCRLTVYVCSSSVSYPCARHTFWHVHSQNWAQLHKGQGSQAIVTKTKLSFFSGCVHSYRLWWQGSWEWIGL